MKLIEGVVSKIFRKSVNVVYLDKLYLSDSLSADKLPELKKKIERGKGSVCLLLKSDNKDDCLDIVTPFQLRMKVWEGKSPVCIGIADSKDSAPDLVETIIRDCLEKYGRAELKEYICSL